MATTIEHTSDGSDEALGADILDIDAKLLTQLVITATGADGSWQMNATPTTLQHALKTADAFYSFSKEFLDDVRGDLDNLTLTGTTTTTKFVITYATLTG